MPSVVDASTLVDLFIGGPAAGAIYERLFLSRTELHAPYSIDLEVANALRKLWRRGLLVDQDADDLADIYQGIRIIRHDTRPVLHRIWRLRYNITRLMTRRISLWPNGSICHS